MSLTNDPGQAWCLRTYKRVVTCHILPHFSLLASWRSGVMIFNLLQYLLQVVYRLPASFIFPKVLQFHKILHSVSSVHHYFSFLHDFFKFSNAPLVGFDRSSGGLVSWWIFMIQLQVINMNDWVYLHPGRDVDLVGGFTYFLKKWILTFILSFKTHVFFPYVSQLVRL